MLISAWSRRAVPVIVKLPSIVGVTIVGDDAKTRFPVPVWFVVVKAVPPAIDKEVVIATVLAKVAALVDSRVSANCGEVDELT